MSGVSKPWVASCSSPSNYSHGTSSLQSVALAPAPPHSSRASTVNLSPGLTAVRQGHQASRQNGGTLGPNARPVTWPPPYLIWPASKNSEAILSFRIDPFLQDIQIGFTPPGGRRHPWWEAEVVREVHICLTSPHRISVAGRIPSRATRSTPFVVFGTVLLPFGGGKTSQHVLLHKNLQTIPVSSCCWWPHPWPAKSCEEKSCDNHFYLCGKTRNKNLSTRSQADVTPEVCWCHNNLYQPKALNLINWVL